MSDEDLRVVESMKRFGGWFVKALAEAAARADSVNLAKIKTYWADEWRKYAALANVVPPLKRWRSQ